MRIISKFHDYYDSLQNPADPFVWVRETTSHAHTKSHGRKNDEEYIFSQLYSLHHSSFMMSYIVVGFCGRIFPMIEVVTGTKSEKSEYYASMEDYKNARYVHDTLGEWRQPHFFEIGKTYPAYFQNLFFKYHTPAYIMRQDLLISNPRLKDLYWAKKFPPFQCYQEIEIFLTNDLAEDRKDKIKIDEKNRMGNRFDKWSFRKLPWKKK